MSVGVRTCGSGVVAQSGRPSSLERYRRLLQDILGLDIAYTPISAQDGGAIDPQQFCWALRGVNAIGGAISRDIKASVVPFLDEVEPFGNHTPRDICGPDPLRVSRT